MPDPDPDFDFAVIGGGSAGYAAARTAVDLGLKTVVIDGAKTLGGLCILRGCMPSKTLIESANRFLTLRRAPEFGLHAENLSVNPREIRDRKRRLIAEFADYRQGQLLDGRFELVRGHGRFAGPNKLDVTLRENGATREITFRSALIATGSTIQRIPIPGLEEAGYLTSDDALDSDRLPSSIIILGGGAIAMEMAHYFNALETKVTVIQRSPHILKDLDPDVSSALENALRTRGVSLFCDTMLEKVTLDRDGGKTVHFQHHRKPASAGAEEILLALGRRPATDLLQLDGASIRTKGPRVLTNTRQATTADHIFAAGDVSSAHEIVHIAIEQGEAAATNAAVLLGKLPASDQREMDYRLKLLGVFTEPQVASLGMTESEASGAGIPVRTASYPFDDHGKSLVLDETHGFVKLIAHDHTGEILGAAAVGPHATELIHEITVAMHFHATAADLASIPHYHPTLSEIWTYPAEDLAD